MNKELSERQKEIITASLELISEKGIQGLTIKNLAKKIKVAESAIYRHYENKTQILIAMLDTIREQSLPDRSRHDIPAIERIERRFRNHFRAFAAFPALVSVAFSEDLFQNEQPLIDRTKEIMQKSITDMSAIIKTGQIQGELRADIDPEQLAIIMTGTIRMFVKRWKMADYSFDLIKQGDDLIESIKRLLHPQRLG
jgi:AcrR family transcriptional regulator